MGEKHEYKKFPHIYRTITAHLKKYARPLAPLFIALGIIMIGMANIAAYGRLPNLAKTALANPLDTTTLKTIATNIHEESARQTLSAYVLEHGNEQIVTDAFVQQQARTKKLVEINLLIRQYPKYPDAYAYKALLLTDQGQCDDARVTIQKARLLDPNRKTLQSIEKELELHCQ
ncbi:MAG: hypothetical protein NUV65_00360 [Candidatus Roizmanbacteria bacterium]|nr:hypothetical protein [Candidatus Roizmanbacteria bacterium]